MKKCRLDQLLVRQNLAADLKIAGSLIVQGLVHTHNRLLTKPGMLIDCNEEITVKMRKAHNYVSRAALKLKEGLEYFNIKVKDKVALDLGCCTGGFTEVLLEKEARIVFAVDVAYGEFHSSLRNNEKIILLERTNAKFLTPQQINIPPEIIVCDASFIGLKTILPTSLSLAAKSAIIIALIKPQFEARAEEVEEGGLITNPVIHNRICNDIKKWFESQNYIVRGIIPSPIKGMKGNQEFLICAVKSE